MSRSKSKWDLPEERRRRTSAVADLAAADHEGDGRGTMQASSAMRASAARIDAYSQNGQIPQEGEARRRPDPIQRIQRGLNVILIGLAFVAALLIMLNLILNAD